MMSISMNHLFKQGPSIRTLAGIAFGGLLPTKKAKVETPGPVWLGTVPPRSPKLIEDYIKWTGGDPVRYEGSLPPHFFPQWSFPLMSKALGRLPWPMSKVINQGCRLEVKGKLPADQTLCISAQLVNVLEEEHKVRITTRLLTGTQENPDLLSAEIYAVIPLGKSKNGSKREPPLLPMTSEIIAERQLSTRAGLDFALLTGDFNPIHWLSPFAKMAGFKRTILHGFASFSLAWEALSAHLGTEEIAVMDARFTRPQLLPGDVVVAIDEEDRISMGHGLGEKATMLGTFQKLIPKLEGEES